MRMNIWLAIFLAVIVLVVGAVLGTLFGKQVKTKLVDVAKQATETIKKKKTKKQEKAPEVKLEA